MNFFEGITTLKVLKMKYRELCKMHHPDLGGDTATMQAINLQYEEALKHVHDDKGERLNAEGIKIEKALMDVINKIVALRGIIIEVTGRWIWITGDTRQYKDYFKVVGCFWSHKKCAWYWRPEDAKVKNHRPYTLEQIRSKFGSINIGTEERPTLS